jgi:hypothetical protein
MGRIVGESQVGEDSIKAEMGQGGELREDNGELLRLKTDAPHAGIDLEVKGPDHAGSGSDRLQPSRTLEVEEAGDQFVLEETQLLSGITTAEDNNRLPHPGIAQLDPFFDDRHSEEISPGRSEDGGNPLRAMPVSVGLDHRQDLSGRTEAPAHLQQVVADGGKVDLDISGAVAKHEKPFH